MEEQTALVLAVQLTALFCIAGSLLLYLICKVKRGSGAEGIDAGVGRSILVTSVENVLGLQVALRCAALGFKVFAGFQDPEADAAKILRAKLKQMEATLGHQATVVLLPLDVTREDSLHEAVDTVRRHLPAGQNGLWAVLNTAGVAVKGRLETQESCQWDSMFKVNVVGTLRTARAFLPLLKITKGRLLTVGLSGECNKSTGVVAYAAARHAVAGASTALANELAHLGVSVVLINTGAITAEQLYHRVKVRPPEPATDTSPNDIYYKYKVNILPNYAVETIESALLCNVPKKSYELLPPVGLVNYLAAITDRLYTPKHKIILENV